MKNFTCTAVTSSEKVLEEIQKLKDEMQLCQHSGPLIRWSTKHNGQDIIANLCEVCGRSWGQPITSS